MEQVTQQIRHGEVVVKEVPWPWVGPGMVLVRNHYSLISAGTEASKVKTARKSLIGKAKERPQQVKQVLDSLRTKGPVQTYRAVMKKLDAYSPLGYSSAGEVIEVGADVEDIHVGDRVACAGADYANHAEIVCVPRNLCVRLPDNANLRNASYSAVGAIALQGIRQADLRLGESCAVIGLGLLGQLTCLMLRASGVRTFGIDIDAGVVEIASTHCCDRAWPRQTPGLSSIVANETGGLGVDAVIITAGTSSSDPINCSGELARRRGRVVVVGAVPTGFDREPHWYKKELELRMSCSYGPGRYDLAYENRGLEYPAAYVRWTENRNMQAFQDLLHSGRIDINYLTTHEFPLEEAAKAYDLILNHSEPFLGIMLAYDVTKPLRREPVRTGAFRPVGKVNLAFIGAGSYAQGNLLPNIPRHDTDVTCKAVMTQFGTTSKRVAERFGFQLCTDSDDDILEDPDINAVFITTRHDTHGQYVKRCLEADKHVFVEKPLCINVQELAEIREVCIAHRHRQLAVGFNRRFAPLATELKSRLSGGPLAMLYRVNAGTIPSDTWIQDKQIGGGRILGEVCHFVDFLAWMCGSVPVEVFAHALPDPQGLNDTVSINLSFADGSVGTVSYFANGAKELPKEYIEVFSSGTTGIIVDFKEMTFFGKGKPIRRRLLNQDKGQSQMMKEFLRQLRQGEGPLIAPDDIFAVTEACFGVLDSIRTRKAVKIG
ncbi:MAG: Gfo/Idh/MocA family oxidoreductase [Phycisphaerae bacterium]|nr:Gfo/Idh/MocA family oxidoreductase [Phycisphaerae bacterium]